MPTQLLGTVARCVLTLGALSACRPGIVSAADEPDILTCDTVTNARPGQPGVTYTGLVSNGDYRFDATIPNGLIGLGSADGAPFHGFAMFVDKSSCILFLIQHRVDLADDTQSAHRERRGHMSIGNRRGLSYSRVGTASGKRYLNTNVLVELPRSDYIDDASITFVTPLEDRSTTEPIFRAFLASFRFW